MTEHEIVVRARQGDQAAFTVLVRTYQSAVYNLCYRMLGDAVQAEDAVQEAFLRVHARFQDYDVERPFRTWLLSIASHHCIDLLRRRRITWLDIDDEPLSAHPALRDSRKSPEAMALESEAAADVQALLDGLPAKDRAAVVLLYWYGLSYQEIADVTGASLSSVKSRLHRARASMAQAIRELSLDPAPRSSLSRWEEVRPQPRRLAHELR